jgi:hypothetical protein
MENYNVIERPNKTVTIVRKGLNTATDPPLTEHEKIIDELIEKIKKLEEK